MSHPKVTTYSRTRHTPLMKKLAFLNLFLFICLSLAGQSLDSSKIDNKLTYTLIDYYKKAYSKYSKFELLNNKDFVELKFFGTIKDYSGWVLVVRIPAKEKQMLFGDITNDKLEDVVVNVIKEGGETGGNTTENDLVIFLNKNGSLIINNVFQSKKICGCTPGYFIPDMIKDNQIIGVSYCYNKNDLHCCPSLKYKTCIVYQNGQLITKERTKE
jgi:hypothetical protein